MKKRYFNPTTEIVKLSCSSDVLNQMPDNPSSVLTVSAEPGYKGGYNM
ncbi:MAG: hypothetical protein MJZ84_05545 [Paludibacteraceae bacterium]|nr:hypothetical protein [Paludibacteraceae bacterium]